VAITASHNLVAYVGDDLSIDCVVASLPPSNFFIRWHKNDSEILHCSKYFCPPSRSYSIQHPFNKNHCQIIYTLKIKNLTIEDSGNYSCTCEVSNFPRVTESMLLTVTVPTKQPNYKSLIVDISIPVSVIIVLSMISMALGFFYYQHVRQTKLQKALEEYYKRPLPKKGHMLIYLIDNSIFDFIAGDYQYEFFFAMTEEDEDKLEVDKLYIKLKQSFSIYYQLDQYLPGRTKVEMVTEGIKNSRFIIIMLSKVYLQQKDEITRLELIYTMNRIEKELTKCAFIVTLENNLSIPYKLQHITKFPKKSVEVKLRELACKYSLVILSP